MLFENFVSWLYCPTNNVIFQNIIDFCAKHKYPYDIIIMKYIQLLCFNGLNNDTIQEHLLLNFNVSCSAEIIEHVRKEEQHENTIPKEIFNICKLPTKPPVQKQIKQEIIKMKYTDAIHNKYPLVDPTRGRPKIEWRICYHEKCMKFCSSEKQLLHHLHEHSCITPHFHKKHEIAIEQTKLTPESIMKNNIIFCPSPICDVGKFESPQHLIKHLTLLGIEPFWKYGMDVRNLELIKNEIDYNKLEKHIYPHFELIKPIFRSELCVCCCEIKPQIVLLACKHSNLCINCYSKLPIKKCPECRVDVQECLPY